MNRRGFLKNLGTGLLVAAAPAIVDSKGNFGKAVLLPNGFEGQPLRTPDDFKSINEFNIGEYCKQVKSVLEEQATIKRSYSQQPFIVIQDYYEEAELKHDFTYQTEVSYNADGTATFTDGAGRKVQICPNPVKGIYWHDTEKYTKDVLTQAKANREKDLVEEMTLAAMNRSNRPGKGLQRPHRSSLIALAG